jgi:hypothetical protein
MKSIHWITLFLVLLLIAPVMATPQTVLITSSQSWPCPTNVFIVQVKMTGGGAGATGGNGTMMGYSGFNSTTLSVADVPVVPRQSYPISIGSGSIGSLGYSTQPLTNLNSATSQGGTTTAFGYSVVGGTGAVFSSPHSPNGGNGYLSYNIATNGQDGYGNISYATKGGTAGTGYGAAGGAGGQGGLFGTGGGGGNGAGGVVEITYDMDASNILFAGTISDASTGSAINGASVSFVQGSTSVSATMVGSTFSVLSASGLATGYTITETISKSGYYTETFSFVPYVSEVIPQTLSLIPITFNRGENGTISGIVRDQYGSSLGSATISMVNTTGSTLSTSSTSSGFYYFQNVPKLSTWYATVNKTGHNESYTVFNMGFY